jgi:hypothetical protein
VGEGGKEGGYVPDSDRLERKSCSWVMGVSSSSG